MSKVLVTGATGFVGKQLILSLLAEGHEVYAVSRIKGAQAFAESKPNLFYLFGDLREKELYEQMPEDIDAAYYLVHSMSQIIGNLPQTEEAVARSFVEGVKGKQVRQIIYLGGIINSEEMLSPHLSSRLLVEKVLLGSGIPTTILRASLIIGSGSASFEIIRDLCEKLPLMTVPKWVRSLCQPIGIADVVFYLTKVLLAQNCLGKIFDIGGPQVLSFKELMEQYCLLRGRRVWIFEVPVLTPRLSSYWLFFVTSVRFSICYYLVESMKSNTVVQIGDIASLFPHRCLNYRECLEQAFQKQSAHQVISTWMDSWETIEERPDVQKYLEVAEKECFIDEQKVLMTSSRAKVIDRLWKIGGENGYYGFDWAWHLRGFLDKICGGIGLNRGRRHPTEIQVGDSIDFWRVLVADKERGALVLLSNMKLPGKAWLSFHLEEEGEKTYLVQKALFLPQKFFGPLYWCSLYPIHCFLFKKMAQNIAK